MLDWFFPDHCVLCRKQGAAVCRGCLTGLPPAPDLAPPPGFAHFASLLSYEGDTRQLISAIKFDRKRRAIELPGRVLAKLVDWEPDCVTWAPTSHGHKRKRGFDQAELLARIVARELGLPCVQLVERSRGSGHQTGRNRAQRLEGVEFQSKPVPLTNERLGSVMLIDDIRTTGATLCAAGDAVLGAGATSISGLTLAVTP